MKKNSLLSVIALTVLPIVCHAEWISEVDARYAKSDPNLYSEVRKAQELISDANGRTQLNYQAMEVLRSVLEKNPKYAPAYVQVARVAFNLGGTVNNKIEGIALASAEDYLRKALQLEPRYDYAIVLMGYSRMFQNDLAGAERYYTQALQMHSAYPYLKAQMAQLASRRGDLESAVDLATQGYNENSSSPKIAAGIINELIFAYERMDGNHNRELEQWQTKRRKLDPSVAWYWGDHGRFRLYFEGDYEKAIEYSKKALSLMSYGVAREQLADSYYIKWASLKDDKAKSKDAVDALKNAESLFPISEEQIQRLSASKKLYKPAGVLLGKLDASSRSEPRDCKKIDSNPVKFRFSAWVLQNVGGVFEGTYNKHCEFVELEFSKAEIRILKTASGRQKVDSIRVGLIRLFSEHEWYVSEMAQVAVPDRVMAAGDFLSVELPRVRVPIDQSLNLSKRWLAVEVGSYDLDSKYSTIRYSTMFRDDQSVLPK